MLTPPLTFDWHMTKYFLPLSSVYIDVPTLGLVHSPFLSLYAQAYCHRLRDTHQHSSGCNLSVHKLWSKEIYHAACSRAAGRLTGCQLIKALDSQRTAWLIILYSSCTTSRQAAGCFILVEITAQSSS